MKVLIQKVSQAQVMINNLEHAKIKKGYVLFTAFEKGDGIEESKIMARKIKNLRIFPNQEGQMDLSIEDVEGEILSISQFTLAANTQKGNRPSFSKAMPAQEAKLKFKEFNQLLADQDLDVKIGVFQEHMNIQLDNDGPLTIMLEAKDGKLI